MNAGSLTPFVKREKFLPPQIILLGNKENLAIFPMSGYKIKA